jgi:hypothetical protein
VFDKNLMKKIDDPKVIWSLLKSTKELSRQVYIWKFIGDKKYLGMVKIESVRRARNDFCLIPSEQQSKVVESLLSNVAEIDLYVPESSLLMRCYLRQSDSPRRYYLSFPHYSALLERRKHLRLDVYESESIKVNFSKTIVVPRVMSQFFEKTITDIGVGGFSFYVSKMELKYFQVGDPILGISFKSYEWNSKLDGEITNIREIEPDDLNSLSYKVWRISCRFRNINVESKKYIEKFILERIKQDLNVISS